MSLLKNLLTETASKGSTESDKIARKPVTETAAAGSTAGGSIANARGSLFGGGIVDHDKMVRRRIAKANRVGKIQYEGKRPHMHFLRGLIEADEGEIRPADREKFDSKDVLSKLDAAQKKGKMGEDTTTFGLEDEEGTIVKVHVPKEQAEEFESALAQLLAGDDDDDDEQNSAMEIAEVLFKLRDKFDIVDVEWPEIPEDAEEDQEADAGAVPGGAEGEAGAEGGEDLDLDAEGGEATPSGDEGGEGAEGEDDLDLGGDEEGSDMEADTTDDGVQQAADALAQVIDMMRADAEAKTAEAKAREAEAKAKEAEALAKTANAKVAAEEQILDMEAHEEKKKKANDEAKTLAKLAKFRHETKGVTTKDEFQDVGSEKDEESTTINLKDFANLLRQHMGQE